MRFLVKS